VKAAFLDRDGVINVKAPVPEYITRWEDVRYLKDVFTSVATLAQAGFRIIVVTNQRGIALGKVGVAALDDIHRRMRDDFGHGGVYITDFYVCPHDLGDGCSCRKPKPGMLIRAAQDHAVDLKSSWMIGDAESDVQAGKLAGCKTVRILSCSSVQRERTNADIVAADLASAVNRILQFSRANTSHVPAVSVE